MIYIILFILCAYIGFGFVLAFKEKHSGRRSGSVNTGDNRVDPAIYDADYYLYAYAGDDKKYMDGLRKLPNSLSTIMRYAAIMPGEKVLDLGCGRGELAYQCVQKGCTAVALDYSADACKLASQTRNMLSLELQQKMIVKQMDFNDLDESDKFDVIFMADLVEHLYDPQLQALFAKAKALLKPGCGRIVIHTAPNRMFINVIFPLKRILNWPSIIRSNKGFFYKRDKYSYDPAMHVNEQTPASLRKHLRSFHARVWCDDGSANIISLLTRSFAGADIWAIARI